MNESPLANRPAGLATPDQLDFMLVDGSGSMQDKWWDSMNAIDAYFGALKELQLSSRILLTVFEGKQLESVQRDESLAEYQTMRTRPLKSGWGMTPLYDAINLMGRRIRDLDPSRCSIIIVTDGQDQGSDHTTADQAKAILDWLRAKGHQVTFIGADFNNSRQAKLLGSNASEAIGVQRHLLADAAKELAKKRHRFGVTGAPMHWSPEEQQQFGGYLSGPSGGQ